MTGVDKLHAEGYFGKGIIIGIIDTGIDYTHPDLGSGIGPNYKVIGGYDLVGDDYTGAPDTPPPKPDNDPLDKCNGHGTEIAGIIGANPNRFNFSGVAYEASINAYRVFGCTGTASDEIVVQALERAYADGNDIITLSLGRPQGWSISATTVVASRIADQGKVVTVAAGNGGDFGAWYVSSPSSGVSVISVGSVDSTAVTFQNATTSNGRHITYSSFFPFNGTSLPIYATSTNTSIVDDACDPLPSSTPNLANYLVVMRRGTCDNTQKLANAAAFGAKISLIYDNLDRSIGSTIVDNYTAALISQEDGIYLIKEGIPANITVTFGDHPFLYSFPTGGLVSYYSSYGPTYDMYFKPSLSAPGHNILSTAPTNMGSYIVDSGTSMSTPLVAGAAALWLQVKGKTAENAKIVRAAFQNTASFIPFSKENNSLLETAAHTGAGLIQVYDAVHAMANMFPAEILLNDTTNFNGSQIVTINNGGQKTVTYNLVHIPTGTAATISGNNPLGGPLQLVDKFASVSIVPSTVVIPAGSSAQVTLAFKPPAGVEAGTFPIYSGFIQAKGDDGSTFHSSYLGVAAPLRDMKVIDNTDLYMGVKLPLIADKNGNPVNETNIFTMQGNNTPQCIWQLLAGSPKLRIDLIDSKSNFTSYQDRQFDEVPTLGILYASDYANRNSFVGASDGNGYDNQVLEKFQNGTQIPDGSYRLLLRAAKIASNLTEERSYEAWTSPEVSIKRP
ncbi:pyrolysin [Ceratobasidium sp. AG-Ba]|nr:pyrolysin [Ceratobasidium sp. AG-Ba]